MHAAFFQRPCSRLVVFHPAAPRANSRAQLRDVEGVMHAGIDVEGDRRAFRTSARGHLAAPFRQVPLVRLADQHQDRRGHIGPFGDIAVGIIGDGGAEPLGKVLRRQVASNGVKRGLATHRLAEDGDPRRIDEFQPRQVAQCRIGIEGLVKNLPPAAAGDAAKSVNKPIKRAG